MQMGTSNHIELLYRFDRGLKLREIIFEAVRDGDFVVDAGCGTGLLSLWAVQAGAERIVAIDFGDLTPAKLLAEENGFMNQIDFLQSDLADVQLEANERCDVLVAMVYHTDPRRDELQHALTHELSSRMLKAGGEQIPDRVEYLAYIAEWRSQDIATTFADIDRKVRNMEGRYGLSLKSLADEAKGTPDPAWFPLRTSSGMLDRPDARQLSPEISFTAIDYKKPLEPYPSQLTFDISSPGISNTVIFIQNLYYKEHLIFSNESVSWISSPVMCEPGGKVVVSIDDVWRQRNLLSVHEV